MTYEEIMEFLETIIIKFNLDETYSEALIQLFASIYKQLQDSTYKNSEVTDSLQSELKEGYEFNIDDLEGFDIYKIPYDVMAMSLKCTNCGELITLHDVLENSNKCVKCANMKSKELDWSDCSVDFIRY